MTNQEIVIALSLFLRDETLEECPISILSRSAIEGEDAELVWFQFGEFDSKCPAIVWNNGPVFTPYDWQDQYNDDWQISDCDRWIDCNFHECVMFRGMPRQLFSL